MTKRLWRGIGFSLIVMFIMFVSTSSILAVDSGWKDANAFYNNDKVNNPDWAYALDDKKANFTNDGDHVTYGFGNNIVPAGTEINGIEIRYVAWRNKESDRKLHFQLYEGETARGNMIVGPNLQVGENNNYLTVGSATNNWGYAGWDATSINNLRVKVSVNDIDGNSNDYLDHIQVRVNYSYVDYNITYVLNGGINNVGNPATYDVEDPDIVLLAPTRAGYIFGGWFANADFTGPAVTVLDTAAEVDYTVYAKWIADETGVLDIYYITYVLNGGTNHAGNPATYDGDVPDILLLAPTRAGYIFGGWFANADFTGTAVTVLDTAAEVDYTVYAKWIADETEVLETYNISYVLNGGVNDAGNPATYDSEDADIVLKAATRTGYIFGGWFTTADFTGAAVTVLDTAAEVDYTVYAKWVAAPVTTVTELPQTGQYPVLIGALATILLTGVGLAVLNKRR